MVRKERSRLMAAMWSARPPIPSGLSRRAPDGFGVDDSGTKSPVVVICVVVSSKYTACFSVGRGSILWIVTRIFWPFCLKPFCWIGKLHPGSRISVSAAVPLSARKLDLYPSSYSPKAWRSQYKSCSLEANLAAWVGASEILISTDLRGFQESAFSMKTGSLSARS